MALPPVLSGWPPSPFDKHTSLLYQIRRGFLANQLFRRAWRNHFAPLSDIRRKGSGYGNVESEHHSELGQPKFTGCAGIAHGSRTQGNAENRREDDLHLGPARSDPLRDSTRYAVVGAALAVLNPKDTCRICNVSPNILLECQGTPDADHNREATVVL